MPGTVQSLPCLLRGMWSTCCTMNVRWGQFETDMNCCCGFSSSIVFCALLFSYLIRLCYMSTSLSLYQAFFQPQFKHKTGIESSRGGEGNVEEYTPRFCDRERAWVEGMFLLSSRWFLARQFEAQHLSNIAKNSVFAHRGLLKVLVAPYRPYTWMCRI